MSKHVVRWIGIVEIAYVRIARGIDGDGVGRASLENVFTFQAACENAGTSSNARISKSNLKECCALLGFAR
jgi:hypothetical protein